MGVFFSDISLRAHQAPPDEPFAVIEKRQGRNLVYRANPPAMAQGIEPGMSLGATLVLCRELHSHERNRRLEEMLLRRYAHVAAGFTPRVVLAGTECLLLEVRASLRLFGGLRQLHEQLQAAFDLPHVIACAPVVDAAELMARNGIGRVIRDRARLQSALGDIGLQGLPLHEKSRYQLQRCGLRELRDLWRLPRSDLARRFGPDLLNYLDQLNGQRQAPRPQFEPGLRFRVRHEFSEETECFREILHASGQLLQQAARFLRARVLLCEQLRFHLGYGPHHRTVHSSLILTVHSRQGGDAAEQFLPQLEEQLQKLSLEAPLTSLELRIRQFKPRVEQTADLFSTPCNRQAAPECWSVLLDLLLARFGHQRIYRLRLVPDYRPEHAWSRSGLQALNRQHADPWSRSAPERPAWLLPWPIACIGSRFRLISDPERLEFGWWDDDDQRREYYRGIAPSGRHCWLYRDLQSAGESWYLHGLFA